MLLQWNLRSLFQYVGPAFWAPGPLLNQLKNQVKLA